MMSRRDASQRRLSDGCLLLMVSLGLVTGVATPATAFKWHECPAPPLAVYRSTTGATNSPFVHPGHDLTIFLNKNELKKSAGFALQPSQNRIRVTFDSLVGSAFVLPDLWVGATSNGSLTFPFPDSAQILGRPLAGPVKIEVFVGTRTVAFIDSSDLVALPPRNNGTAILVDGVAAQAAVAADGDLWIPVHFDGDVMPMPGCEGDFIHPEPILISRANVVGLTSPQDELLNSVMRVDGYMGDMTINGTDFYGWLVPQHIRAPQNKGPIDRLNDATDLVIRVAAPAQWVNMSAFIANSAPLSIVLSAE